MPSSVSAGRSSKRGPPFYLSKNQLPENFLVWVKVMVYGKLYSICNFVKRNLFLFFSWKEDHFLILRKFVTMRYSIYRECWNGKTYNGYTDNPYWRISYNGIDVGLTDDGKLWSIKDDYADIVNKETFKKNINTIIKECKLNISLK